MSRFYITTAIDYANGDPHLGHAFEKIGADAIARYHRLRGDDVWFLIGMDEHGQKVAQTAAERGLAPQELTDRVAESFQAMWHRLGISNDQFIRTTDPGHKEGVRELIEMIFLRTEAEDPPERRDFYEKSYAGWYCVGCESFKQDAEIVDGKCVLHPTRVLEWVEEKNWFFRLSRYADFLRERLTSDPEAARRSWEGERPLVLVRPESRYNEIRALLDQGLEDISASRARFAWGVPFPRPTSDGETQTTYVWFDALPNYWTATRLPGAHGAWPAELHVIGKDITRFHCVIWPAMLQAARLALPRQVFAHGFVNLGGERFSKSAGVKLDLGEAVDRYGPDAFRYFLLREVPFDADGNFSWERFEERYTADLANAFGNLASRTIAMIERYCGGIVPAFDADAAAEAAGVLQSHQEAYVRAMDGQLLHEALAAAFRIVSAANGYVDQKAPWKLAKDPAQRAELERTLAVLAHVLARLAVLLSPFMPSKAEALWMQLGAPSPLDRTTALRADVEVADRLDPSGWRVVKGEGLFPRDKVGG
ncbi:MAG TPA: methionine--tRNA ligase [Gemmatimonadaceae bacterium]|nr:methionine--tRNA ligase [Gemmatimonadaceae bacterium]